MRTPPRTQPPPAQIRNLLPSVLTACSRCTHTTPTPTRADLVPIVDCLKLPDVDAVNACIDSLSPWLQIDADSGDVQFSANAINGFIGGTVGVVGTVLATQKKKAEVKDRLTCVYCGGSGTIKCGTCAGTGSLLAEGVTSFTEGVSATQACGTCEGTSHVVCINCQGSGMSVPDDFLQVLGDEEVRAAAARANTHTPHPSPFSLLSLTRRPFPPSLRLDSPRRTTSDYSTRRPSRKAARPP